MKEIGGRGFTGCDARGSRYRRDTVQRMERGGPRGDAGYKGTVRVKGTDRAGIYQVLQRAEAHFGMNRGQGKKQMTEAGKDGVTTLYWGIVINVNRPYSGGRLPISAGEIALFWLLLASN